MKTYFLEFDTEKSSEFREQVTKIVLQTIKSARLLKKKKDGQIHTLELASEQNYNDILLSKTKLLDIMTLPHKEITTIKKLIVACLDQYLDKFSKDYNGNRPSYLRAWPNAYNRIAPKIMPHIHHYNPLNISGVYYVSGEYLPGNGDLKLYPNGSNSDHRISYQPQPGKIIFFSSQLPHTFGRYESKHARISIAFDIWFRPYAGGNFICLE